MITWSEKGGGEERMHLRCRPFRGHAEALQQYMWHRPMQHVRGYTRSHWTLPLGDYSLRIVPMAARETANKTTTKHVLPLLAVSIAVTVWRYYTPCISQWRRFMAFIKATTTQCRHRASTRPYNQSDTPMPVVSNISLSLWNRLQEKGWSLITIWVWHTKLMRST